MTVKSSARFPRGRDGEEQVQEFTEKVIHINRVAKVVKGGRRFSFSALVVVGNEKGKVGLGFGKANEVPDAIRKGIDDAKKNMFSVPLRGTTIWHQVFSEFGAAKVLMKPASDGTGVIAGGAVRQILEKAGIKNVLTKNLGSTNPINSAKATILGLKTMRSPEMMSLLKGEKKTASDEAEETETGAVEPVESETGAAGVEGS